MKRIVLALALLGLACQIDPVITNPPDDGGYNDLYSVCRRAARDYCRDVLGAENEKHCISEKAFECVAGRSR